MPWPWPQWFVADKAWGKNKPRKCLRGLLFIQFILRSIPYQGNRAGNHFHFLLALEAILQLVEVSTIRTFGTFVVHGTIPLYFGVFCFEHPFTPAVEYLQLEQVLTLNW